jgi:hypothetical protein
MSPGYHSVTGLAASTWDATTEALLLNGPFSLAAGKRVMMAGVKRKRLLVVLALAALGVAGTWVLWPRPPRVTRARFDRIQPGMTLADVQAIVGGPPADYRSGPTTLGVGSREILAGAARPAEVRTWKTDEATVVVSFDADGHAVVKSFSEASLTGDGLLDRLRWRLGKE